MEEPSRKSDGLEKGEERLGISPVWGGKAWWLGQKEGGREEEGVSDLDDDLGGDDPGDDGGDIGLGEPEFGEREPTWAEMKEA